MATEQQIIRESPDIEALKIEQMLAAKNLAAGFSPEAIPEQTVAGQTAGQIAARDAALAQGVGSYLPYLSAASNLTGTGAQVTGEARGVGLGALGQYDPRMAYGYMDPYQQAVTDQTMRELDRQAAIQASGAAAQACLLYTSPSPRDGLLSRMPSSA